MSYEIPISNTLIYSRTIPSTHRHAKSKLAMSGPPPPSPPPGAGAALQQIAVEPRLATQIAESLQASVTAHPSSSPPQILAAAPEKGLPGVPTKLGRVPLVGQLRGALFTS